MLIVCGASSEARRRKKKLYPQKNKNPRKGRALVLLIYMSCGHRRVHLLHTFGGLGSPSDTHCFAICFLIFSASLFAAVGKILALRHAGFSFCSKVVRQVGY